MQDLHGQGNWNIYLTLNSGEAFDATDATSLAFQHRSDTEGGNYYDRCEVHISVNDFSSYSNLINLGDRNGAWGSVSLGIPSSFRAPNFRMRFYFRTGDSLFNNYYGHTRAGTYSHQMRPDISIEFLDDEGGIERIILLDPKYRVSAQSLNQAMDDLHCYKDAIVDPNQRRLVHTALALCPSSGKAKGLYFRPEYIQKHGLGALVLQPRDRLAVESLAAYLAQFVFEEANA